MPEPVGYCAAILSAQDEFQGYFIYDTPGIAAMADEMVDMARQVQGSSERSILAALESTLAEGCKLKRDDLIAPAALAIRKLWKTDYFYVVATLLPDSTGTNLIGLHAKSVDEARDEINTLSEVIEIKKRLMAQMLAGRKH